MKANSKMLRLLEHETTRDYDNVIVEIISQDILNPRFKEIHKCILIDNEDILEEEKINIERVLKIHGDKTGYEASVNEVRINDYFIGNNYKIDELASLGESIIRIWKNSLNISFPESKFIFLMIIDDRYLTLRVHKKRADEKEWLRKDIEGYQEAIGIF